MTFAETLQLLGLAIAAIGALAGAARFVFGGMLRAELGPIAQRLASVDETLRKDLERLDRGQDEHAHRLSALELQAAKLDSDKVGHAQLHEILRRQS